MLRILIAWLILSTTLWSQATLTPGVQVTTGSQIVPANNANPISHIIIIMMENRTPDNLFQTLGPNGSGVADIATTAPTQFGTVTMTPVAMAAPFDMAHTHEAWLTDWHQGAMDRFDNAGCSGTCPQYPAETYVQAGDVTP